MVGEAKIRELIGIGVKGYHVLGPGAEGALRLTV